ncbi:MAG: hypothetical protein IJJ99_00575 [Oscillospiraceae bacterium]|nr:hypothetical protein [Oscillospiraceae bacterium]
MKKTIVLLFAALLCLSLCACVHENVPYEPETPPPAAHAGVFASAHGTMTFSGDGESVVIDFDADLAELTGLPEGEHAGTYVFLSGELPPNGSVPIRYDAAHELKLTVDGQSAVIELGLAAEDGKSAQSGVNTVTPERIPLLFFDDGSFSVVFELNAD